MKSREHLVYMANQIARNFAGDPAEAARATAGHVIAFWEPRMIAEVLADPEGLAPVAAAAFEMVRAAHAEQRAR